MNIDLLMTQQGDAGLVSDQEFESPVAGIMFDAQTRQITLEHANMDTVDMNIPVEDDITDALLWATSIQVGVITNGQIQDNRQIPLMLLNDPDGQPGRDAPMRPSNSVTAFEHFLKTCVTGQPIHREDLGNEDVSGSVVGGINRAVLEFSPQLSRQRTLEASHDLNMGGGPSAPGMNMGGGGGGGSSTPPLRQRSSSGRQETRRSEEDKD